MDFKAIYNRDNFIEFFRDKLLPEDFSQQTEIIKPDFKSNYYQEITFLGNSPSLDLNVYEIKHSSEKDARVGLSRDAFKLVSRFNENNALILFVPENPANFRLSLVTIDPKLDAKGVKILKEYSNPRRYSFVLGEDAKTHTPEQYLIGLGRISNTDDLKKRFSVEVVNKEFYGQIAEMFSKLVGGKRKKENRTVEYQRTLELPSVSAENDQKYKEFAVRLIGRTVFCWFLKKKKSNNNIPLIDNDVLSRFASDFTPNFYHARIEPLFFEILNTAIEKRKPEYKKTPFDTIPFLNGGLFEPHTDDYYVKGTPNYALKIPDDWWKEFLEILETYNFTIDENTSIDIDLSVDPEMLGRIFENLLAEINPETGETARKATGSYYTPRPIVEYMVDQSIKQYLTTKANVDEEKLDVLLDYSNELSGLTTEEEKQVLEAINTIKVLDPACGSGAFPMGMLQKLLLVLQKVDKDAISSVQQILNDITDPVKRDLIKRKLEAAQVLDDKDFDDYARKLTVIQRSIYGVDIQPIAADISRLRFFLSLIVDEVIQDEMPNRGIEPLPNLEFKFVCANTLIPLPAPDSFETMFGDTEIVQELEEIRTRYFTASNEDKPALKSQFEALQKKLFTFLTQNKDILSNPNSRMALLASWKPFDDETSGWFDIKMMFGVMDGFDVVIGNPPYIGSKGNENIFHKVTNTLFGQKYFERWMDYFYFFFHLGLNILIDNGVLCFITTNYFLTSTGGKKLRFDFYSRSEILELINFNELKIFEAATGQHNAVTLLKKTTSKKSKCHTSITSETGFADSSKLKAILSGYNNATHYFNLYQNDIYDGTDYQIRLNGVGNDNSNNNSSALLSKLKKGSLPLGAITNITMGIVSLSDTVSNNHLKKYNISAKKGDGIYVLSHDEVEKLKLSNADFEKFIKPFFKNSDIKHFFAERENKLWLIYSKDEGEPIKLPKGLESHFEKFKDLIVGLKENFLKNEIAASVVKKWFAHGNYFVLFTPKKESYFISPKIVAPYRSKSNCFAYVDYPFYGSKDIAYILPKHTGYKLKYLTCILNSKLIYNWLYYRGKRKGETLELYAKPLSDIPIKNSSQQNLFVSKYNEIVTHYYLNTIETLNIMVYKLYELTYKECKVVDPEIEKIISREDYERLDIEGLSKYEIK